MCAVDVKHSVVSLRRSRRNIRHRLYAHIVVPVGVGVEGGGRGRVRKTTFPSRSSRKWYLIPWQQRVVTKKEEVQEMRREQNPLALESPARVPRIAVVIVLTVPVSPWLPRRCRTQVFGHNPYRQHVTARDGHITDKAAQVLGVILPNSGGRGGVSGGPRGGGGYRRPGGARGSRGVPRSMVEEEVRTLDRGLTSAKGTAGFHELSVRLFSRPCASRARPGVSVLVWVSVP